MTAPNWSEVAEVLKALAAVLWPAVIIFGILRFHKDVRALIGGLKLRRGKFFGQEFELAQLEKLEKETRTLQPTADAIATPETSEPSLYVALLQDALRDSGASPKVALMLLQAQIEQQLRLALKNRGITEDRVPYLRAIEVFRNEDGVPPDFGRWLQEFRQVRNAIIHGRDATDEDALRAVDIGGRILAVLNRITKRPPGP